MERQAVMEQLFHIIWLGIQLLAAVLVWQGAVTKFGKRWYIQVSGILAGILLAWGLPEGFVQLLRQIYGMSMRELHGRQRFYLVLATTGRMLALLVSWSFKRYLAVGKTGRGNWKWLALSLLFPLLSFLMELVIFWIYMGRNDISSSTFGFCCVLLILNVVVAMLVSGIQKSTRQNHEMALLHKQLLIQTESIISLEKSYRSQRQATHDYQNQLQTILRLLSDGDGMTAREYVRLLLDDQSVRVFSINSGNPIMDAVVHQKFQTAEELGIEMRFHVNDLSGLTMKMNDAVVLLSNLLDNAIEGCQRFDGPKHIECSVILEENLFISIRNTSPPVAISGKTIPTSKEPKEEHGFGMLTIRHILDENRGEYTFQYHDGWFEFVAEIPQGGAV